LAWVAGCIRRLLSDINEAATSQPPVSTYAITLPAGTCMYFYLHVASSFIVCMVNEALVFVGKHRSFRPVAYVADSV